MNELTTPNPARQMNAGAPLNTDAEASQRASREAREPARGGLDTGARGWRWMQPQAGARQMRAGERSPASGTRVPR